MKKSLLLTSYLLVFIHASLSSQTKTIPYQELPTAAGSPTGSGIFFGAGMTPTGITVTFEGPSNRWIAIGFGNFMNPTDALIYSNGVSTATHALGWMDYINGSSGTSLDASQDWNIVSNLISAGQRTVVATRALNTGDANDAVFSLNSSSLNLIWATSSTQDYTIAYHGSSNRAYGIALPWMSQPTASFSTTTPTICAGTTVTFTNLSSGGLTSYTWSFPGGNPSTSTSTNPTISYSAPGSHAVMLIAANSIGSGTLTQINYITVNPTVVPAVSIGLSSGSNPMCSGGQAVFTTAVTNGGPAPAYQWRINGVNAGANSPGLSTANLVNSDAVTCVLITNSVCAVPSTQTSSAIIMTVNSTAAASVSVDVATGTNPMCNNTMITFTATPGNGGPLPSYQWQVNAMNTGSNSPLFTSSALSDGDVITCQMLSSSSCASSTVAGSPAITITVSAVLIPSIAIAMLSGSNPLCAGSPVSFSAFPANGGVSPSFQWNLNAIPAGSNSSSFTASNPANGNVVTCILTSGLVCASPGSATSGAITLTVNPVPAAPTIASSGAVICAGSSVLLTSSAPTGNTWSTGDTSFTIAVSGPGSYSVTQTSNGCTSVPSSVVTLSVQDLPAVGLSNPDTVCIDSGTISLSYGTPPGGAYSGAGVSGATFDPLQTGAGTFSLTYSYTDNLGCTNTATVPLHVSSCTGIGVNAAKDQRLVIYPNPTRDKIFIRSLSGMIISVTVMDLTGKTVLSKEAVNRFEVLVDLSNVSPGIYVTEIILDDQVIRSRVGKTH